MPWYRLKLLMNADALPPSSPVAGDDLTPRGPWSFMGAACRGGFSPPGLQLLGGWLAFSLLTNLFWALHLRNLIGWSALPNYWGEILTARDLWELTANGGLNPHWVGPWVPLAAGSALVWFLWAGWRHQAEVIGLPARFGAWLGGALDTLAIGALPLGLLAGLLAFGLAGLGGTGIQGLGWLNWVGGSLVRLAFFSALFLQWWLCRLGRACPSGGFRLGRHLGLSFRRFWLHPVQWFALVLAGVALRTGLTLAVLGLAWRWGGGTVPKVFVFLALQLLVVLVNAWLIGWFLRLTALFLRHDVAVRAAIEQLKRAAQD